MANELHAETLKRNQELQREIARLDYEASAHEAADRLRFQQEIGLTACKSSILVNGGAIIALLTFIGNHPAVHDAASLKAAFGGFSLGIASALLSLLLGYWGQEWLSNYRTSVAWNYQQDIKGQPRIHDIKKERTTGWILMAGASGCAFTAIGSFIYGAYLALGALL